MKGIYLVFVIVIIAVVINRLTSLFLGRGGEKEELTLMDKAYDILHILTSDENCLAHKEIAKIEGKSLELATHPIIDVEKLKDFSNRFADIDPDCAKEFNYGYRVEVETLPLEVTFYEVGEEKGVFQKILDLIDGKRVVFLIDVSSSMKDGGGHFCDQSVLKYQCLGLFLAGLELGEINKCRDIGFVDLMNENSEISVIAYGSYCDYSHGTPPQDECEKYCGENCVKIINRDGCGVDLVLDFTKLNGGSTREEIKDRLLYEVGNWSMGNTPIGDALEEGFRHAINNYADAIVLLTDGSPTCVYGRIDESPGYSEAIKQVREVVNRYKDSNIPVYTITFGVSGTNRQLMDWIAKETGGAYFDASTCEELLTEPREIGSKSFKEERWGFGDSGFSRGDSLRKSFRVSIPVTIRYNESFSVPGRMKITIFDGELETFVGFIEKTCITELNDTLEINFHNPIRIEQEEGKYNACMEFMDTIVCQRIACSKNIVFPGIRVPGRYVIHALNEGDTLRLVI